jgi:short-subunit dehydrogenase
MIYGDRGLLRESPVPDKGLSMANQLAVVTGASSGIGFELAKVLAGKGYDLIVAAESERLDAAVSELNGTGVSVQAVRANLADKEGVDTLWKAIEATGRPVDVACINAGVGVGGLFYETPLDAELNMVLLNCAGTVHLAKHVVKQMLGRGEGRILFTASIAGEMVAPREAVYAATKAFVLSFAKSLHFEMKDTGVTVTALQPGPTDTDFFHRAGMDNTQVGQEGKKESSAADVAKDGIDALFDGKEHVYAASFKTKTEGAVANFVPDAAKAAMHEKMAKPLA